MKATLAITTATFCLLFILQIGVTRESQKNTQDAIALCKEWERTFNQCIGVVETWKSTAKGFENVAKKEAQTREEAMRMLREQVKTE